jgi:hypothetical protein
MGSGAGADAMRADAMGSMRVASNIARKPGRRDA